MSALGPFAWSKTKARSGPSANTWQRVSPKRKRGQRNCYWQAMAGRVYRPKRREEREADRLEGIPPRKYLNVLIWLDEENRAVARGEPPNELDQWWHDRKWRWLEAAGLIKLGSLDDPWVEVTPKGNAALEAYRAIPF